jgi:predicted phosphatase
LVERNVRINEGDELWLDTRVYEVREIDDVTGAVKCFDEELKRLAVVGFKHPDMVFKLVPKHGNPLHKQRNRTRKIKRNKRK